MRKKKEGAFYVSERKERDEIRFEKLYFRWNVV